MRGQRRFRIIWQSYVLPSNKLVQTWRVESSEEGLLDADVRAAKEELTETHQNQERMQARFEMVCVSI